MLSTFSLIFSASFWSLTHASKSTDDTSVLLPESFGKAESPCHSIYDELGCTPLDEMDENWCPKQYDCGNLRKLSPHTCNFNGKALVKRSIADEMKNGKTGCSGWCRCMAGVDYRSVSNSYEPDVDWSCAWVECFVLPKPGCVNLYANFNDCCPIKTYCEGKDPKPVITCVYKGKTFVEGEIINDEERCRRCICNSDFNDSLQGSFCRKEDCTAMPFYLSRVRENCKPVYRRGVSYCPPPPKWHVSRMLHEGINKPNSSYISGIRCKFGDLAVYVGEKLVKQGSEYIECSCINPPHVTCIRIND